MYEYAAKVLSVHDGDTCELSLDLGFSIWVHKDVRLFGIDAPELVPRTGKRVLSDEGEAATIALMNLLGGTDLFAATRTKAVYAIPGKYVAMAGKEPMVVVQTRIDNASDTDKYGRILATLEMLDVNVNQAMVAGGYAKPY